MDQIITAHTIIDKIIKSFLEEIQDCVKINVYTQYHHNFFSFPILSPIENDFYEYSDAESNLSRIVRSFLINPIILGLLKLYNYKVYTPNHKRISDRYHYNFFENMPLEFMLETDNCRIGYCYSDFDINHTYIKHFIKKNSIKKIIAIKWITESEYNKYYDIRNDDHISIQDFFCNLFSKEIYDYFIQQAQSAVEHAHRILGFQAIRQPTARNLALFRNDLSTTIKNSKIESYRYQVLHAKNYQTHKYYKKSLSESDYNVLNRNFILRYHAIAGSEGYAKCFITSEYLYSIFKKGSYCDYTAIICGYLKSVEQLLYKILCINMQYHSTNKEFWIKSNCSKSDLENKCPSNQFRQNPETNKWQVRLLAENEELFDKTCAPLIWFLYENQRFDSSISTDGIKTIKSLLLRYTRECRNSHFHKDNITDFSYIDRIRNNTYMMIYFLLGGCILSGNNSIDTQELGCTKSIYNCLYLTLLQCPRGYRPYKIQFNDDEEICACILRKQDDPLFDRDGDITSSNIKLVYTTNFNEDYIKQGNVDIIINESNIPKRISLLLPFSGEREIWRLN